MHTSVNFDGGIREFPGICADRFNTGAFIHLLTHSHADHLVGLDAKSFEKKVYCSTVTRDLLKLIPKYKDSVHLLTPIEFNKPFNVFCNGYFVKITLIPAYHCPGASMFLLEGSTHSVLITGDTRAEKWWVEFSSKNPFLFPYTCTKTLLNIYFDSTFGYRGEPYIEMPPNNDGIQMAIELLKLFPLDPEINFNFRDKTLGFEEAWAFIVSSLDGNLNVDDDMKSRLLYLQSDNTSCVSYGPLLHEIIELSTGPSFHVGSECLVTIKQCIDFNIMDLSGVFLPLSIDNINEPIEELFETKLGNKICKFRGRNWIQAKDGKDLLPTEIKLIFSRHSSYVENCDFISKFKPLQVFPCTDSANLWKKGFSMNRLFGKFCRGTLFDYDNDKFKQYGNCDTSRPVLTVDRWNPDQINQDYNKMLDLHGIENHEFIGQYYTSKLSPKDKMDYKISWNKDMRLQNIIAGRNEAKYKKMIEGYQRLYHQNIQRNTQHNIAHLDHYESSESSFSSILVKLEIIIMSENENNFEPASEKAILESFEVVIKNEPDQIKLEMDCIADSQGNESRHSNVKSETGSLKCRPVLSRKNHSVSKPIRLKSGSSVLNKNRVETICSRLREDSAHWFGFTINSVQSSDL